MIEIRVVRDLSDRSVLFPWMPTFTFEADALSRAQLKQLRHIAGAELCV